MKNKLNVGRPQAITKPALRKLQEAFLMGFNDLEACIYAQISKSTLYDYQKRFPKFVEYKEAWKVNPILRARYTIFQSLHKVNVAKWYLQRYAKEEFSKRHKIELDYQNDVVAVLDTIEMEEVTKTQIDPARLSSTLSQA